MAIDVNKFRKDYGIKKVDDGEKYLQDIKLALKDGRKNALTEDDKVVLNDFLHRAKILNGLFDLSQEDRRKYQLNYYLVFPVVPSKLLRQLRDCANLSIWSTSDAKALHTAKNVVAQEFMSNPFGMFPMMNESDKGVAKDVASALEYYKFYEQKTSNYRVEKMISDYPDEYKKLVGEVEKDMKKLELPSYVHCVRLVADGILGKHDLVCLKGLEKQEEKALNM